MAGLGSVLSGFSRLFCRGNGISTTIVRNESSVPKIDRNKWVNALMARDVKRRKLVKDHATMRVRIVSMKRNNILPPEIRELACEAMETIPRQSTLLELTNRCAVTSRPRGVVYRWRLSRIVFRHLVDYNKLGGVQRALW